MKRHTARRRIEIQYDPGETQWGKYRAKCGNVTNSTTWLPWRVTCSKCKNPHHPMSPKYASR